LKETAGDSGFIKAVLQVNVSEISIPEVRRWEFERVFPPILVNLKHKINSKLKIPKNQNSLNSLFFVDP